jgi:ParG protein
MKRLKPNPRIIVTFPREKMVEVKAFCNKHGMRIAEVIRRGVDLYIKSKKENNS